jgi:hypothetical protein
MAKKTQGVEELVREVLQTISAPYGEDVTEDVCLAIEKQPIWKRRYNELVNNLSEHVVNRFIGTYTKQITGLEIIREVPAKRSKIIKLYTKLH